MPSCLFSIRLSLLLPSDRVCIKEYSLCNAKSSRLYPPPFYPCLVSIYFQLALITLDGPRHFATLILRVFDPGSPPADVYSTPNNHFVH